MAYPRRPYAAILLMSAMAVRARTRVVTQTTVTHVRVTDALIQAAVELEMEAMLP